MSNGILKPMLPFLKVLRLAEYIDKQNARVVDELKGYQLAKDKVVNRMYRPTKQECVDYIKQRYGIKDMRTASRVFEAAEKLELLKTVEHNEAAGIELTLIKGDNYTKSRLGVPTGVIAAILEYYNWFLILIFTIIAAVYSYLSYHKG